MLEQSRHKDGKVAYALRPFDVGLGKNDGLVYGILAHGEGIVQRCVGPVSRA